MKTPARSEPGPPFRTTGQGSPLPHAQDPPIGRVIGDFRVESPLGQGGMGTVYLGRQLSLNRPVALKFLRTGPGIDPKSVARFEAEARVAAALNHPNVVGIYTLGNFEGLPFIAMELVPGSNLGQILANRLEHGLGPPRLADCVSIMRQATAGIQAAAELGLVHRDIKPENLMLTPRGVVKVADFGLARDLRPGAGSLTETGITLGTPLYMSPEQVLGRPVDARSDIYSLGMTFHHLLTGRPPLSADSPYLLGMKQVQDRPPDVREDRPDCPEPIGRLIARMIEKRPEDRPASAAEVAATIAEFDTGGLASVLAAESVAVAEAFGTFSEPLEARPTEAIAGSAVNRPTSVWATTELLTPPRPRITRRGVAIWACWTGLAAVSAFALGRSARRRSARRRTALVPEWPPGLNLADWSRIPRRDSAEKQYRHALLHSVEGDRIAAWLAVPGNFPADPDWSWRAYVQLTSHLVRTADIVRLVLLREGLARCGKGVAFEHLAEVIQAAIDGAEGNEIGMLETLHPHVKEAMDLVLAELILTILTQYRLRTGSEALVPTRVSRLQAQLLEILRIDPKIRPTTMPGAMLR